MNTQKLELPNFPKFMVSFEELIQDGVKVDIEKGNLKRNGAEIVVDPARFKQQSPWPKASSPSLQASFKETDEQARPLLYKDRRRVVVFIGLMLAWLFVSLL